MKADGRHFGSVSLPTIFPEKRNALTLMIWENALRFELWEGHNHRLYTDSRYDGCRDSFKSLKPGYGTSVLKWDEIG